MKEFKVLKFIDKFKFLFTKFGVDYQAMRRILQIKLIMDGRRVPTVMNNYKNDEKEEENKFFKSLISYFLLGIVLAILVGFKFNMMYQMTMFFGIMMFMLMTTLISDFSSVLLDLRDKNIIFTKPVDSKTINTAKVIHILIYMFSVTTAITGLSLLVSLRHGVVFFLILFFEIIFIDIFMIAIIAALYTFILKFFDGEKLKDIINYVQIILTIFLTVGYQFIGRLFSIVDINVVFNPKWWQYLIPPIWFAAPFEVILNNNYNSSILILALMAIIMPIVSIVIYINLIPTFERNLQKLNNNSNFTSRKKKSISESVGNLICFNKIEKIFYKFTCNIIKNEREFKLKIYPSLGFAIIFPFIFLFNTISKGTSLSEWINHLSSTKYYFNIYFCAMSSSTIIMMIKYSEKYKGAWIYKVAPIKEISPIFKGTIKACLVKLIIPIYIVDAAIFSLIFGIKILPHLIIVFLNIILYVILCFKAFNKALPFSKQFQATQDGEGLTSFLLFIALAIMAGVHYGLTNLGFNIYLYMGILSIGVIIFWKNAFNISLDSMN
ncbi:hypothetical protein [uncultured Clostridium sp.]|uniref:hypothetical protein n=1 Tax=uncultured Clostridium sp. TaxID=59620 RepID=UPI0028EF5F60|nr:hypothetical protein [uncultured Clostridium sp.]